jgi:hypothetical protein
MIDDRVAQSLIPGPRTLTKAEPSRSIRSQLGVLPQMVATEPIKAGGLKPTKGCDFLDWKMDECAVPVSNAQVVGGPPCGKTQVGLIAQARQSVCLCAEATRVG